MKLYNSLSRQTEDFYVENDKVKLYVCGITPYAPSHMGHAMCAVVFDVLRRYLEFKNFEVEHIQNFTDIDDKMIAAANDQVIDVGSLAERNITAYLQELEMLNVLPAMAYPRATREITRIIDMVEGLIKLEYAYEIDGDVYFRVRQSRHYGKLSHRTLDNLLSGGRLEIDQNKEYVGDFALWKSQKVGEPAWDSPWGPGRPGWHIECSAMSLAYLGESIDIHGGGQDLIFPHHENEVAQSEAFTDSVPFVRFWIHNGTLGYGQEKMSKSIGNVIAVGDALKRHSPDAIRLFFLSSHYRSRLTYSEQAVYGHERGAARLRNALLPVDSKCRDVLEAGGYRESFVEAMDEDLNTPRAIAVLFDLARDINRHVESGNDVVEAQVTLQELSGILGLSLHEPTKERSVEGEQYIQLLIDVRAHLRDSKQFATADYIRDKLAALGVMLEDSTSSTIWRWN